MAIKPDARVSPESQTYSRNGTEPLGKEGQDMSPRKTSTEGNGNGAPASTRERESAASENWDQVTEHLQRLRDEMGAVSAALQGLAKAGVSEGRERAMAQMDDVARRARQITDDLSTQGARAARQASDTAGALARDAEAAINRNPIAALFIALGVGFLIGLTSRRR